MQERQIEFSTKRTLNVLYEPILKAKECVLFSHGFLGNISSSNRFDILARGLHEMGVSTLRFDYSGCGKSYGQKVSLDIWQEDLEVMLDFIHKKGYEKLYLLGYSLGALIGIRLLSEKSGYQKWLKGIIFINPVTTSIAYSWESRYNIDRLKELETLGYMKILHSSGEIHLDKSYFRTRESLNQKELFKNIEMPIYILHGELDERVPVTDSLQLIGLNEHISVEKIVGCDHGFQNNSDEIELKINEFIKKWR